MRFRLLPAIAIFLSVAVVLPQAASARIKLITLPVRQRVEIQLDHANATLVEEERIVPLVAGVNQVDFSWANTQIDPGTIIFRVMLRAEEENAASDAAAPLDAKVLSVSYPPGENALVWQVSADRGGSARVRISYLLGNLSKSFNYRAVAAHDESTLLLSQYIRLENFANEEFLASGLWAGFGNPRRRHTSRYRPRPIIPLHRRRSPALGSCADSQESEIVVIENPLQMGGYGAFRHATRRRIFYVGVAKPEIIPTALHGDNNTADVQVVDCGAIRKLERHFHPIVTAIRTGRSSPPAIDPEREAAALRTFYATA